MAIPPRNRPTGRSTRGTIPLAPDEAEIARRLLGVEAPPAAPATTDEDDVDELTRARRRLRNAEAALDAAIAEGKAARGISDLTSTVRKLREQLKMLEREAEVEAEQDSEETARAEVVQLLRALPPDDPLREELRKVLG